MIDPWIQAVGRLSQIGGWPLLLLLFVLGALLAAALVAWLLLPLALYGIKPLLRRILAEQQRARRPGDTDGPPPA